MKIGLSMLYCLGQPFAFLLEELQRVEVENIELIDEGLHSLDSRRVQAIKKRIQDKGVKVTVHAPFVDVNIASPDASIRRTVLRRLERSVQLSSQLDAVLWVFHSGLQTGISHFHPGVDWELNLKSVRDLCETAEHYDVNISVENAPEPFPFLLKSVKDFLRFYEALGETDLGLTLDVGHANLNGQVYEFIERFPDRIVHAHLHDNLGDFDKHLGIGIGNIDWQEVVAMFKKIGYEGTLVIESEKEIEDSLLALRRLLQGG